MLLVFVSLTSISSSSTPSYPNPFNAPKCLELGRRFSQLLDTLSSLCGAPAESALGEKGSLDDTALFCEHAHLVHGLCAFQPAASSA